MKLNILKNKEGTALLVALLVMGVLIAVSLALSTLIFREARVTRGVLDAGKAYYAAESGVEVALYNLNNKLAGWETPQKGFVPLKIDDVFDAVAELKVDNTCNAYPCFDVGFDPNTVNEEGLKVFYDVLDLNESISIPLFVVRDGKEVPVQNFTVEFFAPFSVKEHFSDQIQQSLGDGLQGWDILRWKVFGLNKNNETESISDFTALSSTNVAGTDDEAYFTNAAVPSWFGSVNCSSDDALGKRYTDKIKCIPYLSDTSQRLEESGQKADIYIGTCPVETAREHYIYGPDGKFLFVTDCYPIKDFMDAHQLNYLTLTNLMNPAVFKTSLTQVQRLALSRLYFRVELFADPVNKDVGNQTVREFADITVNGYSGGSKQSINVQIQRGSFMPVFHFSLYSTYTGIQGYDYYYDQGE